MNLCIYVFILYYSILYYTIPYYTVLYYTILYYTILYYTIQYNTILYYTILYYTIVFYTWHDLYSSFVVGNKEGTSGQVVVFFRSTKAQFEICRIDIVMNLCIYIFIYLYSYESMNLCVYSVQKQNTCCFSFSNMYSFDWPPSKHIQKTQRHDMLCFFLTLTNKTTCCFSCCL